MGPPEPRICPQCGHDEEEHDMITFEPKTGGAVICHGSHAGGCACLRSWFPTLSDESDYTYVVGLVQSFAHDEGWDEDRLLSALAGFERHRKGSVPEVETAGEG